jgi:hypothetical protein
VLANQHIVYFTEASCFEFVHLFSYQRVPCPSYSTLTPTRARLLGDRRVNEVVYSTIFLLLCPYAIKTAVVIIGDFRRGSGLKI